jgi:hypothetical protein
MQVTLTIPDDLAIVLESANHDPARAALEAIGLEALRERKITAYQLRTMLGISPRYGFDGFLKEHQVETYGADDFEHDLANLDASTTPT